MTQLISSSHRQNHFCAQELNEVVRDFSCFCLKIKSWSSSVSEWVGYLIHSRRNLVLIRGKGKRFFSPPQHTDQLLRSRQTPIEWIPELKQPAHEADYW